ncbi:HK97-gp10 family putative phage morphogenesis protein [Bacillus sp. FSL M8-0256]|uniref:HK97-gp10 family putative phage morphogenesis protein n=1 Tax=Bacillus sp. FSL M8-0256 TaxID=2954578 RepID=UPI000761B3E0|nr:HK97-gp10 family putative phage morphogenesis protein [Bacillus pumilus]
MADMDIDGFDDLTRFFNKIGDDVEKAEKIALKAGGEVIAEHQKRNVNKSSKNQPHMVDNITVSAARESKDGELFVTVGPNRKVAYRGRFLEWGTSKMPPHPFIEKGGIEGEGQAVKIIERIITAPIK